MRNSPKNPVEIRISKASDDPVCARVSCGGKPGIGFYCVYRGSVDEAIDILARALGAMQGLKESPLQLKVDPAFKKIDGNEHFKHSPS